MHGLGHLVQVRPFFQAGLGVGVDAVRALDRMGHGQGDQGLFPLRQGPFGKNSLVIVKKFLGQDRRLLPDFGEFGQILGLVIGFHELPLLIGFIVRNERPFHVK